MGTLNILQPSAPTELGFYRRSPLSAYIRRFFSFLRCTACGHSQLIIHFCHQLSFFFIILLLCYSSFFSSFSTPLFLLALNSLPIPLRRIPISCPICAAISPIPIFPAPISTAYPNSAPAWILFSSPSRRPSVDRQ